MPKLDHIVFAATDLAAGTAWATEALGCPPSGGGAHPLMGTHNALWRLGGAYLEVIAVDPAAPRPGRARWFGLDSPTVAARLSDGPQFLTWVLRVEDLSAARTQLRRDPGEVLRVTRDALYWDLTVPADGALIWAGAFPTLIRWPEGVRPPGETLPESGASLSHLSAEGPAAFLADMVALGADAALDTLVEAEAPSLTVRLRRPDGREVSFRTQA